MGVRKSGCTHGVPISMARSINIKKPGGFPARLFLYLVWDIRYHGPVATIRLQPQHTAVLIVDVQEKLLPPMHDHEKLVAQIKRLLQGANALGLPLLVTEQYPKGLGPTVPQLMPLLSNTVCRHEKLKFSACTQPVRQAMEQHHIRSVVVCGIEAHVCVLQTCLDLVDHGFTPAVVVDAIGSRRTLDRDTAMMRMVQSGVTPTTVESALLELVHEAGGDRFKSVLPVIR